MQRQIISENPDIKYRLNPNEINLLFASISEMMPGARAVSFEVNLNVVECQVIENAGKKYIIFPLSKDDANPLIEKSVLFIANVIEGFLKSYSEKDAILVMPLLMCQCFHYTYQWMPYARRAHVVLLTIDLGSRQLELHDSQVKRMYPDVGENLAKQFQLSYDSNQHYHAYSVQQDNYSCGYYTYRYALALIDHDVNAKFNEIKLDIARGFSTKLSYLAACVPAYTYLLSNTDVIEPIAEEEFHEESEEGFILI